MKHSSLRILAAAVATAAPLGLAQANDFIQTAQTGYFQEAASMPKSSDPLLAQNVHVRRTPLLWEIVTYDNAAPGAQGPIREEPNPQEQSMRAADEGFWQRMYPIGDSDTP
ncbi:MAG TPA: hypothetical protein VF816_16665 [Rhodocyclaceae bacterium]